MMRRQTAFRKIGVQRVHVMLEGYLRSDLFLLATQRKEVEARGIDMRRARLQGGSFYRLDIEMLVD